MISNPSVPLTIGDMGGKDQEPTRLNEEETAQEPPGFESRVNVDSCYTPKALIRGCADIHTNSQEDIVPPGFERRDAVSKAQKTVQIVPNELDIDGQATQDNLINVESATTRDQDGMNSCEKLAKEALRIGQVLGIKVLRNEQAAIECIVESMSQRKGVQTRSSKKALLNQVLTQNSQQH